MIVSIISFTNNGLQTATRIKNTIEHECSIYIKSETVSNKGDAIVVNESLKEWTKNHFASNRAIIFIGATGIAVRAIADYVNNKLEDCAVVVVDEKGRYVIPLLSGHMGGANILAKEIAEKIGGKEIITTATDINDTFAVDIFAKENHLCITNKDDIKKISAKVLSGNPLTMSVECGYVDKITGISEVIHIKNYPPEGYVDILVTSEDGDFDAGIILKPEVLKKQYVLGVGCKKDTDKDKLESYINETLKRVGICKDEIICIASIDIKKDEEAIINWSTANNIPFVTFSADELNAVKGEFSSSDFVKLKVGVDNVCERAALCACGKYGEIVLKKSPLDGMTIAIGKINERKTGSISIVGMGPGKGDMMTLRAVKALDNADVIVGYTVYLDLLGEEYKDKRKLSTPMRKEVERCRMAYLEALKGNNVAVICSGDAGVYGMASLMYELSEEYKDVDINVVAGITSACSGAAVVGAPVNHDFCVISLSDALTSWELIAERLKAAAKADFVMAIYNPSSHKRPDYLKRACDILLNYIEKDRVCAYVRNIEREGMEYKVCTLEELRETKVDMFTTVFIGNSLSKAVSGKMITKRGYKL